MGGNRLVINLKKLNVFIPHKHFKTEVLHCLKFLLEQNDFLCKIDLKDVCFANPLIKIWGIQVFGQPLRVSLHLFWFMPSSKFFYQITKNVNSLLRRINIRVIVYLDDMLFGVCDKFERGNPTTSETTGISGVTDKYRGIDTVSQKKN